jgi:7-cyano-7-deazaguanine synthase
MCHNLDASSAAHPASRALLSLASERTVFSGGQEKHQMPERPRAVVLLSGGLDSATALAEARLAGFELFALTVRYGQRHAVEIEAARRVARAAAVARHVELEIDLRGFGGSALTSDFEVPKDREQAAMAAGIPITYVPARNTVFLSLALAWAETLVAFDVFIGVNCVDYSGYPDCRPEFLRSFESLADVATRAGVEERGRFRIHAPLLYLTKEQIIERGRVLGVDYGLTHSCYDPAPEGLACGRCDSCRIRRSAFERLGLVDPIRYAEG